MKGNVTLIRKVRSEQELDLGYEAIIEFDKVPDIKIGMCEVKNVK